MIFKYIIVSCFIFLGILGVIDSLLRYETLGFIQSWILQLLSILSFTLALYYYNNDTIFK